MGKYDRYLRDDTDPKDEVQIMIASELAEANRLMRKHIEFTHPEMNGKQIVEIREDKA